MLQTSMYLSVSPYEVAENTAREVTPLNSIPESLTQPKLDAWQESIYSIRHVYQAEQKLEGLEYYYAILKGYFAK